MIKIAFLDDYLFWCRVFQQYKKFKEGCESIENELCSICLLTVQIVSKITGIYVIIKNDQRINIHQIADKVNISQGFRISKGSCIGNFKTYRSAICMQVPEEFFVRHIETQFCNVSCEGDSCLQELLAGKQHVESKFLSVTVNTVQYFFKKILN